MHRSLGNTYLTLGVGVGGLSGLVLALNVCSGAWSRTGFGTLAELWIATGAMALQRHSSDAWMRTWEIASHARLGLLRTG